MEKPYYHFQQPQRQGSSGILLIAILVSMALLVYFKPYHFKYLFNTFLGNILLVFVIIFLWFINKKWCIGVFAIFFMIYTAFHLKDKEEEEEGMKEGMEEVKEGMENQDYYVATTWSPDLINRFIAFQQIYNPNVIFDMNIIQEQATPEEAEEFLQNGKWTWSDEIKNIYRTTLSQNYTVNLDTGVSLKTAQTIYNQTAISELLSWNSKEGSFLLSGVTIGHTKGIPANVNNVARCGVDSSGNSSLQKITYTGYHGINNNMLSRVETIPNSEIPKEVNGFNFLNGECNPCDSNYTCPFSLNTGNGNETSPIWSYLWGLDASGDSGFPIMKSILDTGVYSASDFGSRDVPGIRPTPKHKKKKYDYDVVKNTY
jgi:Ca2+/Na+ antiporter